MNKEKSNEAKEYLKRIRWCDVLIDSKLEELQKLDSLSKRITPVLSATSGAGGGNQDKLADIMAKIVDLKREINRDADEFVDLRHEATILLKKIRKPEYYEILHRRYVRYHSFEKISVEMKYSYRNVMDLHRKALLVFAKVMQTKE